METAEITYGYEGEAQDETEDSQLTIAIENNNWEWIWSYLRETKHKSEHKWNLCEQQLIAQMYSHVLQWLQLFFLFHRQRRYRGY